MGIKLVDKPITETTEKEEGEGSELWERNRLHPWRIRLVAMMMAVALVAGVVAIITTDTKPANAATTYCPSTNPQYYRDRGWTECTGNGGTTPKYWAASVYSCQASGSGAGTWRFGGSTEPTWYSFRACQDFYIITYTGATFGAKYFYLIDLYKVQVRDAVVQSRIGDWFNLYVTFFNWVGTTGGIGTFCGTAGLAGKAPLESMAIEVGCGYAYSYARDVLYR